MLSQSLKNFPLYHHFVSVPFSEGRTKGFKNHSILDLIDGGGRANVVFYGDHPHNGVKEPQRQGTKGETNYVVLPHFQVAHRAVSARYKLMGKLEAVTGSVRF